MYKRQGQIDSDGKFSVEIPEQKPGTKISVMVIDEAGNKSEKTVVEVMEATIIFSKVPEELSFKETTIKSNPETIRIPRENRDWEMEVKDTRGQGSKFKILAESGPLKAVNSNHTLSEALVYIDGNSESQSLEEQQLVYSGETGQQQKTKIFWNEDEGPMIEINPLLATEDSYETSINWTLVNGP